MPAVDTYLVAWQHDDSLLKSESTYDPSHLAAGKPYPFTRPASPLRLGRIFEIDDFSLDVANPVTFSGGTGSGTGKVVINPLKITRKLDVASPTIFANLAPAKGLLAVDILQVRAGTTPLWFAAFGLTNAFLTAQSWSRDDEGPKEDLTFICSLLQVAYRMQDPNGAGLLPWLVRGWDSARNIAV